MRAKWGRIVFLSSVVGEMGNWPNRLRRHQGRPHRRGPIHRPRVCLAQHHRQRPCPGFIDTDMTSGMTDAQREQITKLCPRPHRKSRGHRRRRRCIWPARGGLRHGQVLRVNGGMYV